MMQPIFKELIQMWGDLGYPLPIEEGKYWLDNHFVIAFDHEGEQHKLYKYKVFDDLNIEIKPYESCNCEFETWNDTVKRLDSQLQQKEQEALSIIDQTAKRYRRHKKIVYVSTGKDSMVMLDLVKRRLQKIQVYFNNTTLDVADTYKMVKKHKNWHIINPAMGFYQYVKRYNFIPTRISRGCCNIFKEREGMYNFNNDDRICFFMGIRNDESNARADRTDFEKNPIWGDNNWLSCLPIRTWSELEVWLYIFKYNIEINPKYRKGYRRAGCGVCCPFYKKYVWVLDKYWYRHLYDRWRRILHDDFINNERWSKLNCTLDEYVNGGWTGGLYRSEPNDNTINEFMKYKGFDDISTARQYFNKTCKICNKNI